MNIKNEFKFYYTGIRSMVKYTALLKSRESYLDRLAAELIRNTHSIEKGLSIESPRLGFGQAKLEKMMKMIETLSGQESNYYEEVCIMALGAANAYCDFHDENQYADDFIKKLRIFLSKYCKDSYKNKGGILTLKKEEMSFNILEIEKFFNSRHSIREFAKSAVDDEAIIKALQLAYTSPSACNRQAVRTYVLSGKNKEKFAEKLSGIGGFANDVDKYILVCAKLSSYRLEEINQYIVSASMYAAYLSLTLHLYGIGACVIQRPVLWNKEWESMKKVYGIKKDEQIICALAIGNMKDICKVPVSHRIDFQEMSKFF